jgi:hypothetical protein
VVIAYTAPVYKSCKLGLKGARCLSDHEGYFEERNWLIDNDALDLRNPTNIKFEFPIYPRSGRIFKLVTCST